MIKQNLHTHSIYDDGKDTIDAMAKEAIEKGFTLLGWSGHGKNPMDECAMGDEDNLNYLQDLKKAREAYKDELDVLIGIEQDSMNRLDCSPYDYVIGSVHWLPGKNGPVPIDYSKERFARLLEEDYEGDAQRIAKVYFDAVAEMAAWPEVDIIGHIDLLTKYNEDEEFFAFDAPWYLESAKQAIDAGIAQGKIFEMNTGAISRGYRKTPYPHPLLLQYMADQGAKLCINTDCHNKDNLDLGMADCLRRAKEAGFQELYTWKDGIFVPVSIEEFVG